MAKIDIADITHPALAGRQQQFLLLGGVGVLACAAGLFLNPTQFYQSYLMGYMLFLGIALGCLAVAMLQHLSGGEWGFVTRRIAEAGSRTLPLMTLLFLPIAFGAHYLYPWARPEEVAASEVLQHKQIWLSLPFWYGRAAFYFAVWNTLAFLLNKWSAEQDGGANPMVAKKMQKLSGAGCLIYGLTMTYAAFDWMMALSPEWFSTIYGLLTIAGQGLSTFAFLIIVLTAIADRKPMSSVLKPVLFQDLGNFCLAFVMLWAYMSFSQYLIIWAGNLPEEIHWYMHRLTTGWKVMAILLIVMHFAFPFAVLLSRQNKRHPAILVKIAFLILFVRMMDLFWLIAPEFHTHGIVVSWLDVAAPVAVGSLFLMFFLQQLRARPLLPQNDPYFAESFARAISGVEPQSRPSAAH